MKNIITPSGHTIKVCDCHYALVKDITWYHAALRRQGAPYKSYAKSVTRDENGRHVNVQMHRFMMEPPDDMVVDHINGNGLDNRCSNLRICTQAQNALNNRNAKYNSKSGHKGIYWHKAAQKWCAEVVYDKKKYYLGVFKNKLDAVEAYNNKAKELHGEFFSKS